MWGRSLSPGFIHLWLLAFGVYTAPMDASKSFYVYGRLENITRERLEAERNPEEHRDPFQGCLQA